MMYVKVAIALCIASLAVQGFPRLAPEPRPGPDPDADIKYVIERLEDLEEVLSKDERIIVNSLRGDLKSIEDRIFDILSRLDQELKNAIEPMLLQISSLEETAYELGIDISDCVDDSADIISELPKGLLSVTSECLSNFNFDADREINYAITKINSKVSSIDKYWTKIEACREKQSTQRETCIEELKSEISRDSADIPDEMALITEEVLDNLDTLKKDLPSCTRGKRDNLEEIGNTIVANVTACALNKFNPPTTVVPTTKAPTTAEPTETPATATPTEISTTTASTEAPTTATTTETPTTATSTEAPTTAITTETPATTASTEAPTTATTTETPTTAASTEAPTTAITTETPATTASTEAPTTATTTETPTTAASTEAPTTAITTETLTTTDSTEAPTTATTTEIPTTATSTEVPTTSTP